MKYIFKVFMWVSFVFYGLFMIYVLFFNGRYMIDADFTLKEWFVAHSNFAPFETIKLYIRAIKQGSIDIMIPIQNLLGNIVLFIPLGIYLPYFVKKLKGLPYFILIMFAILMMIECVQLLTRRGIFDIDDFILNMIGAFIGFIMWKRHFTSKNVV